MEASATELLINDTVTPFNGGLAAAGAWPL
jgi:hypothetical protein